MVIIFVARSSGASPARICSIRVWVSVVIRVRITFRGGLGLGFVKPRKPARQGQQRPKIDHRLRPLMGAKTVEDLRRNLVFDRD